MRVLDLAKVEALEEPQQHYGRTMDPVEVLMLKGQLEVLPLCQFNTIAKADYVSDINTKYQQEQPLILRTKGNTHY
jgi:hypothetical protein